MTMKILLVATSHSVLGESDRETGVWLEELASPYYVFQKEGCDITIISPEGGEVDIDPTSINEDNITVNAKRFLSDEDAMQALADTQSAVDTNPNNYDAVYFAGGHGTMWDFTDEPVTQLVESFYANNKPVASVCHGVVALVPAMDEQGDPVVKGKTLTCFTDAEERFVGLEDAVPFLLETRLRELGANFIGADNFVENVHVDGCIITGQNPASSKGCAEAVINQLAKAKAA